MNTSNSGNYGWVEPGAYTVDPADVGQTLDFHIGVREGDTRIDAFVFALTSGLSEEQLDALAAGQGIDNANRRALALQYPAPFLTDADMQIYFTDTHGIIEATSETVVFYYPRIANVRVGGAALPVLSRGANALRVAIAPGRHEIVRSKRATSRRPPPSGPKRPTRAQSVTC